MPAPARTITHNGITLTIKEWAKRTNQLPGTLRWRLSAGWPIAQALHASPYPASGDRNWTDRRLKSEAHQIKQEFGKLVFSVDEALRTFRNKLGTLLSEEQTGGAGQSAGRKPS